MPWMRPKFLKQRDYLQNNPDLFESLFEDFLNVESAEDYVITGAGIEVPSNANIIKTKPGPRSKGRESRTTTIKRKAKKLTAALKRKADYQDEDWL